VSCTVGTPSPAALTFAAGDSDAKTFTLAVPANAAGGAASCSYVVSGAAVSAFAATTPTTFTVLTTSQLAITGFPSLPPTAGQQFAVTVTPLVAPVQGDLIVTVACTGTNGFVALSRTVTFDMGVVTPKTTSACSLFVVYLGSFRSR
jgi:hypothetical protein